MIRWPSTYRWPSLFWRGCSSWLTGPFWLQRPTRKRTARKGERLLLLPSANTLRNGPSAREKAEGCGKEGSGCTRSYIGGGVFRRYHRFNASASFARCPLLGEGEYAFIDVGEAFAYRLWCFWAANAHALNAGDCILQAVPMGAACLFFRDLKPCVSQGLL